MKNLFWSLLVVTLQIVFCLRSDAQAISALGNPGYENLEYFDIKAKMIDRNSAQTALRKELSCRPEDTFLEIENQGNEIDELGYEHEKYQQYYKGIRVEYGVYNIHIKDNFVTSINGDYEKSLSINTTPSISSQEAFNRAKEYYGVQDSKGSGLTQIPMMSYELVICKNYTLDHSPTYLAYKIDMSKSNTGISEIVYVNAHNGKIIQALPLSYSLNGIAKTRYYGTRSIETAFHNGKYILFDELRNIHTYNMHNQPGIEDATELYDNDNNWTASEYHNEEMDDALLDAHWGGMMTYDYYSDFHNRKSYDNQNSALFQYVNSGPIYPNACWSTEFDVSVFGMGYSAVNTGPFVPVDIVSHEFTHGVTCSSADLIYLGESGAINEGFSDIFGSCVENYALGATDWITGAETSLNGQLNIGQMRNIANPNSSHNPDTYHGYFWNSSTDFSNIGSVVHQNSTVLSHWFYLLAEGGSGYNNNGDYYHVDGIGIEKAAKIAYRTLTTYLVPASNYMHACNMSMQAAIDFSGPFCPEHIAVANAWKAVGIGNGIDVQSTILVAQNINSNTKYYYATDLLMANNNILNNSNVYFHSDDKIRMIPGFKVDKSSKVHASVGGCEFDWSLNKVLHNESYIEEQPELSESLESSIWVIYPNPTSGLFSIENSNHSDNESTVEIYDGIGQQIFKQRFVSDVRIDISDHPSGLYFVKIESGTQRELLKVLKQ